MSHTNMQPEIVHLFSEEVSTYGRFVLSIELAVDILVHQ